ncbi:SGNH/GDSL hydrolase family protein [Calycomorphotria hydatis]|uniref:GDSL-like Lipase/Acylhydrolase n=1 Tax=Calycomorphotria hydatis TaxID=2528027 RepID=A0A517T7U8_9PLAN|nr:SGNH/GDSL hydrolase family protein [Calycomorphotria hydatis]QDT64445.1 hypothetical protein V22_16790 [Calycomorphotria hydatis]
MRMQLQKSVLLSLITLVCVGVTAIAADTTKDSSQKPAEKKVEKKVEKKKSKRPNPFAPIKDKPGLPRVLIIGDSISIGYTLPLRKELENVANLHRIPANGGPTTRGLANIDKWLGDSKWDVIQFNWGLHDLKFMDENGKLIDTTEGRQQVLIDDYEQNLTKLVDRLEQTGATLIWRNTTPVPEGAKGRIPGDEVKYNNVAKKIMDARGIMIDDLYSYCMPRLDDIQLKANVHFTPEGSQKLAEQTAITIREALKK